MQKMGNHDGAFRYRMARRLTEMDATTLHHHVRLPFGCQKNRCLLQAMESKKLSRECSQSIAELSTTFELENELEQRQELFLGMMWIYIGTLCILLMQLARRLRSQRPQRQLRLRILQAESSDNSFGLQKHFHCCSSLNLWLKLQ